MAAVANDRLDLEARASVIVEVHVRAKEQTCPEFDTDKIVEVARTSPEGITEAMRSGGKRAAKTLRQVDWGRGAQRPIAEQGVKALCVA
jgi:flavin-binding protein dodecin